MYLSNSKTQIAYSPHYNTKRLVSKGGDNVVDSILFG